MQETCGMMIPTIVYTKPSLSDCSFDEDSKSPGSESPKKNVRQRRPSRSRVRKSSRRLSINRDEHSSSSSRSPSPSRQHINESLIKFAAEIEIAADEDDNLDQDHLDKSNDRECESSQKNKFFKNNGTGYGEYLQLLQVPQINSLNLEWGEPSGDDLSSEWESDYSEGQHIKIIHANNIVPKVNF